MDIISYAQNESENILKEIYIKKNSCSDFDRSLDGMTASNINWTDFLDDITNYWRIWKDKKSEPLIFDRSEMNYDVCKRLYNDDRFGVDDIGGVMQQLANTFKANGGSSLRIHAAKNATAASSKEFLSLINMVINNEVDTLQSLDRPELNLIKEHMISLRKEYDSALATVDALWRALGKQTLSLTTPYPELPLNVKRIIVNRAFAAFFSQEARWLNGLRIIPRDVFEGVIDLPRTALSIGKGAWYSLWHPREAAKTVYGVAADVGRLPYDLHGLYQGEKNNNSVINGVKGFATTLQHHPARPTTSAVCASFFFPGKGPSPKGPNGGAAAAIAGDASGSVAFIERGAEVASGAGIQNMGGRMMSSPHAERLLASAAQGAESVAVEAQFTAGRAATSYASVVHTATTASADADNNAARTANRRGLTSQGDVANVERAFNDVEKALDLLIENIDSNFDEPEINNSRSFSR